MRLMTGEPATCRSVLATWRSELHGGGIAAPCTSTKSAGWITFILRGPVYLPLRMQALNFHLRLLDVSTTGVGPIKCGRDLFSAWQHLLLGCW